MVIVVCSVIGIGVLLEWGIVKGLYVGVRNEGMWEKVVVKGMMLGLVYVIVMGGLGFVFGYKKGDDESKKWF